MIRQAFTILNWPGDGNRSARDARLVYDLLIQELLRYTLLRIEEGHGT